MSVFRSDFWRMIKMASRRNRLLPSSLLLILLVPLPPWAISLGQTILCPLLIDPVSELHHCHRSARLRDVVERKPADYLTSAVGEAVMTPVPPGKLPFIFAGVSKCVESDSLIRVVAVSKRSPTVALINTGANK